MHPRLHIVNVYLEPVNCLFVDIGLLDKKLEIVMTMGGMGETLCVKVLKDFMLSYKTVKEKNYKLFETACLNKCFFLKW